MAFGKGAGRSPQNFRPSYGGIVSRARSMSPQGSQQPQYRGIPGMVQRARSMSQQPQQPQYRGIPGMVQRAMSQRQSAPVPARMMPMAGGPEAMPSGFYGGGGRAQPPAQPSAPPAMNRQIMTARALRNRGGDRGRF